MAVFQIAVLSLASIALTGVLPDVLAKASSPRKSATCSDGMAMVKKYLEVSKVELINNIREAKSHQCKLQSWKKVDPSMVSHSHSHGVRIVLDTDSTGGLAVNGQVTDFGCGQGSGSAMIVHVKGDWKQIMYTQVFNGAASCWGIFGNEYTGHHRLARNSGLEVFNPSFGDVIFGQEKMRSKNDNIFDGKSKRCDNEQNNFWHKNNGNGKRQATVILRRKKGAKDAGVHTGTSCGKPSFVIKDIYVLL